MSIEDEMRPVFRALEEISRMIQELVEAIAANANRLAEGGERKLVYTAEQAAEVLQCSPDLVHDMIKQRRIPFVELGPRKRVVPRAALERWLDDAN